MYFAYYSAFTLYFKRLTWYMTEVHCIIRFVNNIIIIQFVYGIYPVISSQSYACYFLSGPCYIIYT